MIEYLKLQSMFFYTQTYRKLSALIRGQGAILDEYLSRLSLLFKLVKLHVSDASLVYKLKRSRRLWEYS